MEFGNTVRGHHYYDRQLPQLIKALNRHAAALEEFNKNQGETKVTRWYVVRSDCGKFSDGYYGWDAQIHSDAQIFAESELPYVVCPEFKRILVAERQHKPGLEEVLKFLEENYA